MRARLPDKLWTGAVERVAKAGIKQIGLIHRGFSSYGNTDYRNAPMWHLAIEMKRRNPEMMIINDPSHICGRRDILLDTAQKAIDLDFDGLMIESHIDPDKAWSDAKQQVTPEALAEMLGAITWRKEDVPSESFHAALDKLREQINHIDDELMQELKQVRDAVKPTESMLVVDATTGQEAVNVAQSFNERIGITGAIFTKLDGDTRGGATTTGRGA
mgnify:CR=1 FL=1